MFSFPWRSRTSRSLEAIATGVPLSSFPPHEDRDIFIAGYPKSGNTWMQAIVASLQLGLDLKRTPDRLVQLIVPDVHASKFVLRTQHPSCFKTHSLPQPHYRRVIRLLRDGRDAMCSYRPYLSAVHKREIGWTELLQGKLLFPCDWSEHTEQWDRNPYHAEILTVKYEDLLRDPVAKLREICRFIALDLPDSELSRVAASCSFSSMKDRERRLSWDHPGIPKNASFVRKGKSQSFRDELPVEILGVLNRRYEGRLKAHGYLIS